MKQFVLFTIFTLITFSIYSQTDEQLLIKAKEFSKLGNTTEAINCVKKAIEINPEDGYYYALLSHYLRLISQYDEGLY